MTIKSTTNGCCTKKELPFPKLMIGKNTGSIFLMVGWTIGVCLKTCDSSYAVGVTYRELYHAYLSDYEGSITLFNE